MAGFVLFDTQMIMERCRAGSNDCIRHSLDLFFDLVSMFRRLLIILTQKVGAKIIANEEKIATYHTQTIIMQMIRARQPAP